jgi:4-amino-4-deoxy-L-arabinose transferase-like glycosyltransferase
MVFYSRMYIQESMFTCFALAFAIALGRAMTEDGWRWPALAGVAAGLAIATKETSVLMIPAALAAGGLAWRSLGSARPAVERASVRGRTAVLIGLAVCAAVAALFYSSFLTRPGDVFGPLGAAGTYVDRGLDPPDHVHPWHYALGMLAWSSSGGLRWTEALVLGLAAVGAVTAWLRPDATAPRGAFWRRYLTANAAIAVALFSAIPYKTPWNLLPFHAATIVAAGIGVAALARAATRPAIPVLVAGLAIGAIHLGWQAWQAAVVYAADPRNPYVYAQTVPDAVRMAARIRALAALHGDGGNMLVQVIAPPHEQWPLPWYLRSMPHVGYWPALKDVPELAAPVIVSSMGNVEALDAALGDRYVSEFFGVRPEVLVTLYVERGLWDRFLAQAALGGS